MKKSYTKALMLVLVALALVAFASPAEAVSCSVCVSTYTNATYYCNCEWCGQCGGAPGVCQYPQYTECKDSALAAYNECNETCETNPDDEWDAEIIGFREPDPLGGDPAFLRTLGVDVPAPACLSEQAG